MCCNGYTRNSQCGCQSRCNRCACCSLWDWLFGNTQTVCRDCCGNLRVNNGCGCGYENAQTDTGAAQNGNGFTCFTYCRNNNFYAGESAQNTSYCARQYGATGVGSTFGSCYSYNDGCGCNG